MTILKIQNLRVENENTSDLSTFAPHRTPLTSMKGPGKAYGPKHVKKLLANLFDTEHGVTKFETTEAHPFTDGPLCWIGSQNNCMDPPTEELKYMKCDALTENDFAIRDEHPLTRDGPVPALRYHSGPPR